MQGDNGAEQIGDLGDAGSLDSPYLMGVRVVIDDDPPVAAAKLAEELGGDLVFDIETARTAFGARASAGRTDPVVLQDHEFDTLLAQSDELGALDGPAVDEAALAELRELATALGRTDRIRMRTEVEFTETLNRRLSASSGMAIHPETIKQAALAVTASEAEVDEINEAIAELGDRPSPEQVRQQAPAAVPQMFDDERLEQQRRARVVALSALAFFAGASLVLLNFAGSVLLPIAVFLIGVVVCGTMMVRSFALSESQDDPEAREASALLAAATGNAERSTEAGARDRLAEEEWMARRSQFEAARDRSVEKARSARRHWETLAGADADPHDLEGVLRLHDPQFVITGAATKTSPTVRTVNAVHRKAMARWKVAWAALGYDQPPALEDFDEHIARFGGAESRAEAEKVEQRLKAAEAWANAGATIDRPLILVEPQGWLPEEELESMLRMLPAGAEVIIVER